MKNIKKIKDDVNVIINGLNFTLSNNFIKIHFENDATVSSLYINSENLTSNLGGNRTFYLDWNGGKSRFIPTKLNIIEQSKKRVHLMYTQNNENNLHLEYHIIMENDISGIYTYLKASNNTSNNLELSELRFVYRFNPEIMPNVNNYQYSIKPPLYKYLNTKTKIQDETWQLDDGSFYSKYDLSGYVRESKFYGVYGQKYGAWIIKASNEYYSGGPLKQDLLVHQDSLMINYLTSTHYGTPSMKPYPGWSKIYGPWLIYINEGNSNTLIENSKKQQIIEQNKWPYNWVTENLYPINRGILKGKISGSKSMIIINSSLKENFDKQTLGYSYNTTSDENGNFTINNIIPNNYQLNIYPIEGNGCDVLLQKEITISNNIKNLGIILINEPKNIIWNIGETNRKSDEYSFCKEKRNYVWQTLVPNNLDFWINKDNIKTDWYYAQTKPGKWNIHYIDTIDNKNRNLRISISSSSNNNLNKEKAYIPNLLILINGNIVKEIKLENDQSIYRGALNSGNFYVEKIKISNNLILNGENIVTLNLLSGSFMYDCINLSSE